MNDNTLDIPETTPEPAAAPTPAAAAPAKPAPAAFDVAAVARELASAGTGITVEIPQSDLEFLQKLAENPGASYLDLFGYEHGTRLKIGEVDLPNYAQVFEAEAKFSQPTVRATLKKIKAIQKAAQDVAAAHLKLTAQLATNASRAVRKTAAGRNFVEMDVLTRELLSMTPLTNPLELQNRANTRTDDKGSSVLAYITGSAIAPCRAGGQEEAVQDLISRVADHTQTLQTLIGVPAGSIRRRIAAVPGTFTPDRVGVLVQYVVNFASIPQFRLGLERLAHVSGLSTLDPAISSDALLRYNDSFGLEGGGDEEYADQHELGGDREQAIELAI